MKKQELKKEWEQVLAELEQLMGSADLAAGTAVDALKFQLAVLKAVRADRIEETSKAVGQFRLERWSGLLQKHDGNVDKAYDEYVTSVKKLER
jgi:ElaB/YqjD/DUF883 family membrane-anchored ribosome-binding protein